MARVTPKLAYEIGQLGQNFSTEPGDLARFGDRRNFCGLRLGGHQADMIQGSRRGHPVRFPSTCADRPPPGAASTPPEVLTDDLWLVGWVEPFAKPILTRHAAMGFASAQPILQGGGRRARRVPSRTPIRRLAARTAAFAPAESKPPPRRGATAGVRRFRSCPAWSEPSLSITFRRRSKDQVLGKTEFPCICVEQPWRRRREIRSQESPWPDLFRPSTSFRTTKKVADGRDEHGHDVLRFLYVNPNEIPPVKIGN